ASFAIDDSRALIWVVDARKGVTPLDEELARLLRGTGKPVLVAANKTDAANLESDASEFHSFGFADVFPISAEHGNGIGELLDSLVTDLRGSSPTVREGLEEESSRKGAKAQSKRVEDADRVSALPASRELKLAIV